MPVKRRRGKRRLDPIAEAEVWACVFAAGYDFYGEAKDLTGLSEPVDVWPPEARGEAEKVWTAAVRDAWARLGRLFLDRGMNEGFNGEPWALETFGEPEQCR